MTSKAVHWIVAAGVALAVHVLVLLALHRTADTPIEIAGGRIEVRFGSEGKNTAAARADRGVETGSATAPIADEPVEPIEPPSAPELRPTTAPETPNEPQDERLEASDPVRAIPSEEPPQETPETTPAPRHAPVPDATSEPLQDRPTTAPAPPETAPEERLDAPEASSLVVEPEVPSETPEQEGEPGSANDEGTNETTMSEGGKDAADSEASPEFGSPTADPDARHTNLQAGNAEASNYAGNIVRILSRKRLPSSARRGEALISFSLADDGQITSISVADSSGSRRFDRAAVRLIEGCAPFPEPPQGAKRDYTVVIKKD
ncbi:MAG: TonB family protein [Pseudomonadota bacterium]